MAENRGVKVSKRVSSTKEVKVSRENGWSTRRSTPVLELKGRDTQCVLGQQIISTRICSMVGLSSHSVLIIVGDTEIKSVYSMILCNSS